MKDAQNLGWQFSNKFERGIHIENRERVLIYGKQT